MVAPPPGHKFKTPPLPDITCHMTPLLSEHGLQPQRQDRLTGGTGLNMNYLIIFTEISFYPETSIREIGYPELGPAWILLHLT